MDGPHLTPDPGNGEGAVGTPGRLGRYEVDYDVSSMYSTVVGLGTCGRKMQVVICIVSELRYVLLHILILDCLHGNAFDFRWHAVYGCRRDWCSGIDDLFQMGLEKKPLAMREAGRQHDEVETARRKIDEKAKKGRPWKLSHSKKDPTSIGISGPIRSLPSGHFPN